MMGIVDTQIYSDIVDVFGDIPVIAVGFRVRKAVVEGPVSRERDRPAAQEEAAQLHIVALRDQIGVGNILPFKAPFPDHCSRHARGEAVSADGPFLSE